MRDSDWVRVLAALVQSMYVPPILSWGSTLGLREERWQPEKQTTMLYTSVVYSVLHIYIEADGLLVIVEGELTGRELCVPSCPGRGRTNWFAFTPQRSHPWPTVAEAASSPEPSRFTPSAAAFTLQNHIIHLFTHLALVLRLSLVTSHSFHRYTSHEKRHCLLYRVTYIL